MRVNNSVIYDFETMGQDPDVHVVVNMALLFFDANAFESEPYTYQELLDNCKLIKFNVADQVKTYKRKVDPETVKWWSEQSPEAKKKLAPSADDKTISDLHEFWFNNVKAVNVRKVYTRNNTFDPMFLQSICKQVGKDLPYEFWMIRDTKSIIDGMTWGSDIDDRFIVPGLEEKFVKHDPCHDIAMDVMRMQHIFREYIMDDDIPF